MPEKNPITRDSLIGDVVRRHPKAAFVMMQYGLHCVGCHVSAYETVEQGCLGHGMPEEELDAMLDDLNAFIAEAENGALARKGKEE